MAESKTFYGYFKQNMAAIGLPAPDTLFGTLTTALGTIKGLTDVVAKFGTRVTVMELVGAGTLSEALVMATGITAAFYLGACLASLAFATGQYVIGGDKFADNFYANTVTMHNIVMERDTRHEIYHTYHRGIQGKKGIPAHAGKKH